MARKFKFKRNGKLIFRYILLILVIYLIISIILFIISHIKIFKNNEEFVTDVIAASNYYVDSGDNQIYNFSKLLTKLDLTDPVGILESKFGYSFNNGEAILVYNDTYDNKLQDVVKQMHKATDVKDPLVYIYNTHQTESYSSDYMDTYGITPNVLMASYILKGTLDKLEIPTLVEESNVGEFLRLNNWKYNESYKASRFYLLDAINKYPTIKLFIDLHRDSISKGNSTITINNKEYAKVLFVIGKEHENYKKNLDLTNSINDKINKLYPGLSRGVLQKAGVGVNGIYNQDLSEKVILLELGGNKNNINEVLNTIDAISIIIKEYIDEKGN